VSHVNRAGMPPSKETGKPMLLLLLLAVCHIVVIFHVCSPAGQAPHIFNTNNITH
jgi:hypothetical protein